MELNQVNTETTAQDGGGAGINLVKGLTLPMRLMRRAPPLLRSLIGADPNIREWQEGCGEEQGSRHPTQLCSQLQEK